MAYEQVIYNFLLKGSNNVRYQKQKGRLDKNNLTYYGTLCNLLIEHIDKIVSTF